LKLIIYPDPKGLILRS